MTDGGLGPADSTQDEIWELRRKLEQARQRESMLERRLQEVEAELAGIYGSRSWRLIALARRLIGPLYRFVLPARLRAWLRRARRRPQGPGAREALRLRRGAELAAFLAGDERLALPSAAAPEVSILLVLFNQAPLTLACLRAIAATVDRPAEVVIVDNASADETGALLARLDGARVLRNAENRHFLHGVNQAAAAARGRALLLLNNDACLRPGALAAAQATLFSAADIGAVGGPIVLPDGRLQEAGSIIWRDGSCLGHGRGADPAAAEFAFPREVDYCSGAFLLVRADAFAALGGFDPAFAPAYYEETDFCMRLRAAGQRIVYEPRAIIDHFEFASATTSEAAIALQRRNQAIFVARHHAALAAAHHPPGTQPLLARMRDPATGSPFRGRVLMIDDRVPFPSLGSGYPRAAEILRRLATSGWFVTFYPLTFPDGDRAEIETVFPRGIEVMLQRGPLGLRAFLQARQGYYDAVLVSRPHNMRAFLAAAQDLSLPRVVYDAEAVFAAREMHRLALCGTPVSEARREALLAEEIALAGAAATVVTVSPQEATLFRDAGMRDVVVLGHALSAEPTLPGPAARRDLLFVGALDDDPSPNTDSLLWFAAEVMPRLDALLGEDWRLLVAGRCRAERVAGLAGPRIRLLGRVDDLDPLYAGARLFVAPTRFAAGIPHKVHEAAAKGLPVVATPLLGQQLGWRHEQELLVAESADAFAAACARLYTDQALWWRLREAALARLAADCSPEIFARSLADIMVGGTKV